MKDIIAGLAYKAATDHLTKGVSLNKTIKDMYVSNEIENEEVLKRVCEESNKQVYLETFAKSQNRGNITFEKADKDKVVSMTEEERSLASYSKKPKSFRDKKGPVKTVVKIASSLEMSQDAKAKLSMIQGFISQVSTEKVASIKLIDKECANLYKIAEELITHGESVFDMCKIASKAFSNVTMSKEASVAFSKTLTDQASNMSNKGFNVDFETEKTASYNSLVLNHEDEFVSCVTRIAENMVKAASFSNIADAYQDVAAELDSTIKVAI